MSASDADLLTAFARRRDEEAFRQLAARYLGLIFHAALRRTGSRAMAEEVAQNVLCAVARKAALLALNPERLPAWLHRAAVYESTTAMRKEAAHEKKKQQLTAIIDSPPLPDAGDIAGLWQQMLPHLDEALNQLPEKDRTVVLLHFFERLSFPQIGARLGKPAATVQKQSARALEKLAWLLSSRRGRRIRLAPHSSSLASTLGVAAGLAAEGAKAAPVGLVPALAKHAAISAGVLSPAYLKLAAVAESKAFIPCALLALVLPLGLQQVAVSRAETAAGMHRMEELAGAGLKRPRVTEISVPRLSSRLDLVTLADEFEEGEEVPFKKVLFKEKLGSIGAESLAEMMRQLSAARLIERRRAKLAEVLTVELSKKNPEAAMSVILEGHWGRNSWDDKLFARWMAKDFPAASRWLAEQTGKRQRSEGKLEEELLKRCQALILRSRAQTSGDPLRVRLQQFGSDDERQSVLLALSKKAVTHDDRSNCLEAALVVLPRERRTGILEALARNAFTRRTGFIDLTKGAVISGPFEQADAMLQVPGLSREDRILIARVTASLYLESEMTPFQLKQLTPLRKWLSRVIPEGEGEAMIDGMRQEMAPRIEAEAKGYLARMKGGEMRDDQLVDILSRGFYQGHMQEAMSFAAKISDPKKREKVIKLLNESMEP